MGAARRNLTGDSSAIRSPSPQVFPTERSQAASSDRTRGGRPTTLPPVLEERIKWAPRRAGRPCTITDIRSRIGAVYPPSATLRVVLAELLEGGEIRTTTGARGPVRPRRGLVLYEPGPRA
jgi:hypothetical protein